jgi:hypothetical protein
VDTKTRESKPLFPLPVLILAVSLAAGGGGFWYFMKYVDSTPAKPVLTGEAKAYVRNLRLSDVEMKATESYLGQEVVEITGRITNAGDRPLKQVDLHCVFYDPYGQVVLRQLVSIVRARSGELAPGATRDFRLPFDDLPQSWNKAMPQLVIAQINF